MILFESEQFVVVDKPAGSLTVPSRLGSADPRPCLGKELENRLQARLWPVHRLDYEVSGIVLFAKTADAQREASQYFEQKKIKKIYEALTELPSAGELPKNERQLWQCRLLRGKKRAYEHPVGKPAATWVECRGQEILPSDHTPCLRWKLEPITGRSHQLRYELFRHGTPILGDTLYGSIRHWGKPDSQEIALRALELHFAESLPGLPPVLRVSSLF